MQNRCRGDAVRVKIPLMIVHPVREPLPRVHPRSAASSPAITGSPLKNIHVLAVDDEQDALTLVRELLEAAGARMTTARSADEALAKLDAEAPDVVIADLGMPRMDGFGFIAQVRRHVHAKVREVPAAALTAYARSEDRVKALRAGFQIHLAKPIDPAELVTTVAALAKRVIVKEPDETNESSVS